MSNSIADAFKKLNVSANTTASEHDKIFNVSYEYLSKVKKFNDLKAAKNYHQKLNKSLVSPLILEISYVYYKIGKIAELVKLYEANEQSEEGVSIGLKHVLAQSYYKLGDYTKSLELYQQLIKDNKFDDQLDLIINEKAIISQLNFQTGGKSIPPTPSKPTILEAIDIEKISDLMIQLIVKNNLYSHKDVTNANAVDRDLNYQQNLHKLSQN
ncbi:hypothetical protein Cantr_06788 [Candida viswanathii]|uniref:Uncharacterized protein n=1 Tax=Candida viswanathii TaxID=5486 RepID=A0A367XVX4_9ASCO|nr:hypothetical protein Cantr_06788 [Candida viswanathii]